MIKRKMSWFKRDSSIYSSSFTSVLLQLTTMKQYNNLNTNRWLYLLGPVGIFKCVVGVIIWLGWGANIGNHDRSAVASQGVLQYPCQLAVSVRYVSFLALKQMRTMHISHRNKTITKSSVIICGNNFSPLCSLCLCLPVSEPHVFSY